MTTRTRKTVLLTTALLMLCGTASANTVPLNYSDPAVWVSVGIYELLVVAVEWVLFGALFRLGWARSLKITLAANLASFCLGLLPSIFVDEWGAQFFFYLLMALPLNIVVEGLIWRSLGDLRRRRYFWWNIVWVSTLTWLMGFVALPPVLGRAAVRSPISMAKMDMRSMATGIERYYVDYNCYPPARPLRGACKSVSDVERLRRAGGYDLTMVEPGHPGMAGLTSPIAYVTQIFTDPFAPAKGLPFVYYADTNGWILISAGPDQRYDIINPAAVYDSMIPQPSPTLITGFTYDPTNGADSSSGDVWRVKQ